MSLEGDLTKCAFSDDMVIAREESGVLRRNTIATRQNFLVLRIDPETIAPIMKQVMVAGLSRAIVQVQIERAGVLQLGAYDNSHSECVMTGPDVSEAVLTELQSAGILWGFQTAGVSPKEA